MMAEECRFPMDAELISTKKAFQGHFSTAVAGHVVRSATSSKEIGTCSYLFRSSVSGSSICGIEMR